MAARSKEWVCGRSHVGIAGSILAGGMDICLLWCVSSGRGLCDELITRPEESYRLWCVWIWSWTLYNEEALTHCGGGRGAVVPKKKLIWTFVSLLSVATRRLITNNLQYCMSMLHNLVLLTSFWVLKFLWAFSCRSFPTGCGWHPCNKRKATSDYKWQSKCWYRSFVRFRPVKNPLQLADGPTVYVRWQGEGICLVASANHLSVSL